MKRPTSVLARYGIAVGAVVVVLLIKSLLSPFIVGETSFLLFSVAVLVGAVFGGFGPGILATVLGGFAVDYFLVSPVGTLLPSSTAHALRSAFFLVQGLAISLIGARLSYVRHRAEEDRERVLASESRLAEAQKIARIGNWDYDVSRDEAYWSEELYRIFGLQPQEFSPTYKAFLRLVHSGDRRLVQRAIREAAEGATRSSVEYRVVRPSGEVRAASTQYEPIMDESGRMVRLVGTIQDVTERRQAEDALRESEERYRVVAETASDAIIVIDESSHISFVNEAAGRTFGYSTEEMLGEPLTMLMPEHLREPHRRALQRYVITGERRLDWRSVELPGLHKSGRELSLELSFGEFRREGKKYFTGFVRDVSERKRIEAELQISEERFRGIVDQSPLSVQILSPEGATLRVNRAWEELWGATFEEIDAAGYNVLRDEQLVEKGVMPYIERGFAGEATFIPPIVYDPDESIPEVSAHENAQRWVSAFIYPIRDEAGQIREVTLIHEDITERVRAEEALRESEGRFRSTFEQAAVGMAQVGSGGEWLRVNQRLCQIVGYSREELLGMTFQDITHPDDLEGDVQEFHRLLAGEIESYSREKRYLRKDGSKVWINLTVALGEGDSGRRKYSIAVIEDITERKRFEEELVRLASYPRLNPNPIVETYLEGGITYVNPAAEALYPELYDPQDSHPLLEGIEEAAHEAMELEGHVSAQEIRVGDRFYYRVISRVPQSELLRIYATDITERHRAEEELRRSEERFRALIRYGSDIIAILDAEGTVIYESPAIERVMGYHPEERIGRNVFELIHHEDAEQLSEVLRKFADELDPQPKTVEYRSRASDGSWHYFEAIGVNLLRNPSIGGIVVNSRDITERHRAEEELRRGEERYRAVIEQMAEGIFMFEPETKRFVESNSAFERMFGYTGQEVLGMDLYELVAHDPEDVDAYVRRCLEEGNVAVGERKYRHKNGSLLDVEVSGNVIYYGEGREVICAVVRDMSERRRAEEALRQSEALYRTVVEQAAENIFLVDTETGRILEFNAALGNSLGYTPEDLSRMTLYDIVAADRESVDRNIQRVLEYDSYFIGEREYRRRDGSLISVEVGASVIYREGRPTLCVVAHDIEERKQQEEEVREIRQAERSRIARELHDDVLQDIIYALQEAQILEAVSEGEYAVGEIAEALRRSVEGIRAAIFELRLEETIKESFVASMKNTVDLHRRMARRAHRIELEVAEDFPREVSRDAGRGIVRIVQEALSNARRHSAARLVTVSLRLEGEEALVEVADDGRGFDPGAAESGVGTHSTRQRARELGGDLTVETAPGSGTRVRLSIPLDSLLEKRASASPNG